MLGNLDGLGKAVHCFDRRISGGRLAEDKVLGHAYETFGRKVTCPLVNIVEKTGDCPVFARLELQGEHAHAAVFAMAGVNDGPDDSLCLPETLDGPLAGLPPKVTRDPHGVSFRVAGALRVP
jgi:hypothetical protein